MYGKRTATGSNVTCGNSRDTGDLKKKWEGFNISWDFPGSFAGLLSNVIHKHVFQITTCAHGGLLYSWTMQVGFRSWDEVGLPAEGVGGFAKRKVHVFMK